MALMIGIACTRISRITKDIPAPEISFVNYRQNIIEPLFFKMHFIFQGMHGLYPILPVIDDGHYRIPHTDAYLLHFHHVHPLYGFPFDFV